MRFRNQNRRNESSLTKGIDTPSGAGLAFALYFGENESSPSKGIDTVSGVNNSPISTRFVEMIVPRLRGLTLCNREDYKLLLQTCRNDSFPSKGIDTNTSPVTTTSYTKL